MNHLVEAAIAAILELRSKYSEHELLDAIRYLAKQKSLDITTRKPILKPKTQSKNSKAQPKKEPELSKVVADLEKTDPDKFELLSRLDRAIRNGELLKSLDSIRMRGAMLDKEFNPGKSRKGAVSRFMKLLVSLPIEDSKKQIDAIIESERNSENSDEAYAKLASFLIHGKK